MKVINQLSVHNNYKFYCFPESTEVQQVNRNIFFFFFLNAFLFHALSLREEAEVQLGVADTHTGECVLQHKIKIQYQNIYFAPLFLKEVKVSQMSAGRSRTEGRMQNALETNHVFHGIPFDLFHVSIRWRAHWTRFQRGNEMLEADWENLSPRHSQQPNQRSQPSSGSRLPVGALMCHSFHVDSYQGLSG